MDKTSEYVPSFYTLILFHLRGQIVYRRLGAKGSYLTLVRVADRILLLRGDDIISFNIKLGSFVLSVLTRCAFPSKHKTFV